MSISRVGRWSAALVLAAVGLTTPTALAGPVTWDTVSGDAGVTGGAGAWDTTLTNWTTDSGATNIAWVNANNDTAVFGGSAGTVTLGTAITVGGLTFNDNAGYLITGNTLTFGLAGNITANVDATIASALAGNVLITKVGAGKLTLKTASTRTGATQIDAGALRIENATAMGAQGATVNAGTLEIGNVTLDKALTLNNGAWIAGTGTAARSNGVATVAAGTAVTFSATDAADVLTLANGDNDLVGGDATTVLNVGGAGMVLISGDSSPTHSITGTWTIGSGSKLRIERGTDTILGNTANGIVINGGTFSLTQYSDFNPNSGRVITIGTGGGAIEVGSGRIITLDDAGQLAGSTMLTKTGAGTLIVGAANTAFTGDATVSAGTLDIRNAEAIGTGAGKADIALAVSTTLNLRDNGAGSNGTIAYGHNINLNGNATISVDRVGGSNTANTFAMGKLAVGGDYTLTVNNGNSYAMSATALDFGSAARNFTKAGGATLVANSLTNFVPTGSTLNFNAGTLRVFAPDLGTDGSAANNTALKFAGGGLQDLADTNITLNNNFNTNGGNGTFTFGAATTGTTGKIATIGGAVTVDATRTFTMNVTDAQYKIQLGALNNSGTFYASSTTGMGVYLGGTYTGSGTDVVIARSGTGPSAGIQDGAPQPNEYGFHFANGLTSNVGTLAFGVTAGTRTGQVYVEGGSTVVIANRMSHLADNSNPSGSSYPSLVLRGGSSVIMDTGAVAYNNGFNTTTNFQRFHLGGDGNAANVFEVKNTAVDFGQINNPNNQTSSYIAIGGLNFIQHASNAGTNFTVGVAGGSPGYLNFNGLDNGGSLSAGWTIKGDGTATDGLINVITSSATPVDALRFSNSRFVDVQGTGALNAATNVTTSIASGKTVTKTGTGSMTFNGQVTGSGILDVAQGAANINNGFSPHLKIGTGAGTAAVAGGVTTGTVGTLGSLEIGGNGTLTLSPATKSTQWNVAGDVTLHNGSTLNYNITSTGTIDAISTSLGTIAFDATGGNHKFNFTTDGAPTLGQWFYPLVNGAAQTGDPGTPATWTVTGLPSGGALDASGAYGTGVYLIFDANAPVEWAGDRPSGNGWNVTANWTGTVPNAGGAQGLLGGNITGPQTVAVDAATTIGTLYLLSDNVYTINTGTNALTVNGGSGSAGLLWSLQGNHVISGAQGLALEADVTLKASPGASLSVANISGTGKNVIAAGTINLSGANAYTGTTTVTTGATTLTGSLASPTLIVNNGGTLNLNAGASLAAPDVTDNGTINVNANSSFGTLTGDATKTVNVASGLTLSLGRNGAAASTVGPAISGGHLVKNGDSVLRINNLGNGIFESVTINAGMLVNAWPTATVNPGRVDAVRSATGIVVNANGTFGLNPPDGVAHYDYPISGDGKVRLLAGSTAIDLNANNTYTGGTELETGTSISGQWNGTVGGLHGTILGLDTNTANGSATIVYGNLSDIVYDGLLNGKLNVNFTGKTYEPNPFGKITLQAGNTMTGTLQVNEQGQPGGGSPVNAYATSATTLVIPDGGLTNLATMAGLQANGVNSVIDLTVGPVSGDVSSTAVLGGTGKFIKRGVKNLTLTNTATTSKIQGPLQVAEGTLSAGPQNLYEAATGYGRKNVQIDGAGTLNVNGAGWMNLTLTGTGNLTFSGGANSLLGNTTGFAGGTMTVESGTTLEAQATALNGTITNNGAINFYAGDKWTGNHNTSAGTVPGVIDGSGAVNVYSNVAYQTAMGYTGLTTIGDTTNNVTLTLNAGSSLAGDVTVANAGSSLIFKGGTLGATRIVATTSGSGSVKVEDAGTIAAAIVGGGGVTVNPGAGKEVELTNIANLYGADTLVQTGTLKGSVGTIPGNVQVSAGATVKYVESSFASLPFGRAITGNGTFVKDGAAQLDAFGGGTIATPHLSVADGLLTGGLGSSFTNLTGAASSIHVAGTLTLTQDGDRTLQGALTGPGTGVLNYNQGGFDTLTVSGNGSAYAGDANVNVGNVTVAAPNGRLGVKNYAGPSTNLRVNGQMTASGSVTADTITVGTATAAGTLNAGATTANKLTLTAGAASNAALAGYADTGILSTIDVGAGTTLTVGATGHGSVTNTGTFTVNGTAALGALSGTGGATTVNNSLTADSIVQDTLTIGPGGVVTIRATAGMAEAGASAVPEPGTWALLAAGAIGLLPLVRRLRRRDG
jgi:fibronectin-binding autotransporter adhesin